jgi:L-ascorbate metabolism protein UlaG (beta-lactamase superfamily)
MSVHPTPASDAVRAQFAPYFAEHREHGRFRNPWPHPPLPTLSDVLRWKSQTNRVRERGDRPRPIPLASQGYADFDALSAAPSRLFWIGHASFLIEIDRVRFVIDPIFGRAGGLVPRLTPAAVDARQLDDVAAVLVTHGHHDHCDPSALRQLAEANRGRCVFIVPTGLQSALPPECQPVIALDWWQYTEIDGVRVHLVPAQHWHRRGLFDLNKSLWGGYVIDGTHRIYHSGDTGYFGGFEAIGAAFGSIDAACLPLGAYEPRWFMSAQHMSPAESLRALGDLHGTHLVGMHWGAYDLSDEALDAGPRNIRALLEDGRAEVEKTHVLQPGGSLALRGERGHTVAEELHVHVLP